MAEGGVFYDEGKKYFDLLNQTFVQDPDIEEMDFIFCPDCIKNQEEERVAIVNEKHKLGIMSWAVQPLYMFAYERLVKHRKQKNREDCLSATERLQFSRALLLLSAECYTVWNIRKELVVAGLLSLEDDLCFSTLVLSKFPRSAETFSHRKWIINQYVNQKGKSLFCQRWLKKEMSVCLYCVDHYPDNYIAWTHRGWIIDEFIDSKKKLESELCTMEKWVQMHVSDHCGYHFRQKIIKRLKEMSSAEDVALLLLEELVFVTKLQESYPGHESIWYHRRFIFDHWHQWCETLSKSSVQELGSLISHKHTPSGLSVQQCWTPCVMSLSSLCRSALVKLRSSYGNKPQATSLPSFQSELEFCRNISRKSKDFEHLVSRYKKWLYLCCGKTTSTDVDHSH